MSTRQKSVKISPRALRFHTGAEVKVWLVCEDAADEVALPGLACPAAVVEFYDRVVKSAEWYDPDKEAVIVLCLNRKNRLKAWNLVSLGTANSSLAAPREVFRPAIVAAASSVVMIHNHPSGDPAPSLADVTLTRCILEAGAVVDIPLLDHIIIGLRAADPTGVGYYSFRAQGKIPDI